MRHKEANQTVSHTASQPTGHKPQTSSNTNSKPDYITKEQQQQQKQQEQEQEQLVHLHKQLTHIPTAV